MSGKATPATLLLQRASYNRMASAVDEVLRRFPLPLAGSRVLVKPNMLGPYRPEQGVTTHPSLVAAVVDRLAAAGAVVQVGDNPGAHGYGIGRRCAEVSGILEASRGCYTVMGESAVEVPVDSPYTRTVRVSRQVLEADLVISLPKMKTHLQTLMSGAVKNTYGYLVGADKSRLHAVARRKREFARVLADVFSVRPPHLTIMDAVTAMEGDGPSNGSLREVGLLIASSDAVAVDRLVCRLMGLPEERVLYLAEVRRQHPGMGEYGIDGIDFPGAIPGWRLPAPFARDFVSWVGNAVLFSFLRKARLRIDSRRCTACGICRDGCPVGAIDQSSGRPVIDTRACIACYCCHELCPAGAITLTPLLRRALHGSVDHDCPGRR